MSDSSKSGSKECENNRKDFPSACAVDICCSDQTLIFVRKSLQSLDGLRDISTVNRQKA